MYTLRLPLADDRVEEDTGTDRMLKEEKILLRQSHIRRTFRSPSATVSVYEETPKLWTAAEDDGHEVQCARLTASSVVDKDSDFWTRLPQLQKLEVEDGKAVIRALTKRFSEIQKLETLSITWTDMKKLPSGCLALPLKTLILRQDHLRSLDGIEHLTMLEILDVTSNSLKTLPKNLGSLENIRMLNICGNKLRHLPESLGRLHHLETLDCSSNRLTVLPDSLTNLEALVGLDISSNHIDRLPEEFGKLSKLTDLRASGNQLTSLPKSFAHLSRLVSLLLGNNKLLFVPMELGALERLENLNLRNNYISSVDCALSSVKTLILEHNRLGALGNGICCSAKLEILSLERNQIKTITDEIGNLKRLRSLQLNENPLSEIPDSVFALWKERQVKVRLKDTKFDNNGNQSVTEAEVLLPDWDHSANATPQPNTSSDLPENHAAPSLIEPEKIAPDPSQPAATSNKPDTPTSVRPPTLPKPTNASIKKSNQSEQQTPL